MAVTFGTAMRGLGGLAVPNVTARPSTAAVYQLQITSIRRGTIITFAFLKG